MGFNSQSGSVTFRTQAVAGTYQADTLTAGVGALLRSGALGTNRDLLVPEAEIGGGRDVVNAYLGSASFSGEYAFYVRMELLKTLFKGAFGTATPATTTGLTTTTSTPVDNAPLPFLSVHEEIAGSGVGGNQWETFNYNDAYVNTLALSADANAYFMGTVGLIAKGQVAGATAGSATTIDNTPLTVATNIAITYNAVTLPAKSFSLSFTNNIDDSDFRLGSFFLGDLTPKRRELTASFTIRETSSALWRQATYGLSSATSVGGLPTKQALVISAQTYENIAGATPNTPYGLTLTIPNYILSPYTASVSGDDILDSGIDGRALRPAIGTPLATAVIKGGTATVA